MGRLMWLGRQDLDERPDVKAWVLDALSSADDEGAVSFGDVGDWFLGMSLVHGMWFSGWVARRDGRQGGPWVITPAGRKALQEQSQ